MWVPKKRTRSLTGDLEHTIGILVGLHTFFLGGGQGGRLNGIPKVM